MQIIICKNGEEVAKKTANLILKTIKTNKNPVLGLATGSTPLLMYKLLVEDFQQNCTSWANVITFNLDEYCGLSSNNEQSYRYYMNENLFKHINIDFSQTYLPNGNGNFKLNAEVYENQIINFGPIDLQILGIGTNGHIGFNEPGTDFNSLTHVVNLNEQTIKDNARFFNNDISQVPKQAITMGIKTILNSKVIVLMASGINKAEAIYHLVNTKPTTQWPCTALQSHDQVIIIIDKDAASLLKKS